MGRKTSKKRIKHRTTQKKEYCAPSSDKKSSSTTCYTEKKLQKMRSYWNKRHPDAIIKSRNPQLIWKELKTNMSGVCNTERCWLKQKFISESGDNELLNYTFVPEAPNTWKKNPNEWLTSVDIENVMKQYEHAYPCFQFLGPSPIDFDKVKSNKQCVWDELCNFHINKYLRKGCHKIGIIFNTDPHYLDGSHWISLFIDIKNKYIYFFDSVGDDVPDEIELLMDRIISQCENLNINLKKHINTVKHQRLNTECGMYSLYFIINAIKDRSPIKLLSSRISDKEMEKFRSVYFNPNH